MGGQDRWYFHWMDWLVFGTMLLVSASAGLWYYWRGRSYNTEEYLLGISGGLKLIPVSCSLIASFVSGITILGTPAEIYNFGTQYWVSIFGALFGGIIVATVYLPVFFVLRLNSAYEYLEIRFGREVRALISMIFVIDVVLYESIVVYVPSLALNQASGIDLHLIASVVYLVCVFYTVMGGLRAVVWTDTIQVGVMIVAMIVVTLLGTNEIGGPYEVWERAAKANRIEIFNFDASLYTRHTFWTVLIGSGFYNTAYLSVNQIMVQRYRTLPDLGTARIAISIFVFGLMSFISLCCWCGLVLVAWYSAPKCDPRASGLIIADDQLLPAYVMEIAGKIHGVPGLFIAGIFGAALSTLSVGLNSTSVVLLEDFVKGLFRLNPSDRWSSIFVKSSVIVLGLGALILTLLVENLGGVLAMTASLAAITAGTSFGVFSLGMLFPWTNSKGAFVGGIAGYASAAWVSLGNNAMIGAGQLRPRRLPVDLSHCHSNVTEDFLHLFDHDGEEEVFPLYRLSYHWVTGIGTTTVIIVGLLVSFCTGFRDVGSIDRDLLSPVIHRWLPDQKLNRGENKRGDKSQRVHEDDDPAGGFLLSKVLDGVERPSGCLEIMKSQ